MDKSDEHWNALIRRYAEFERSILQAAIVTAGAGVVLEGFPNNLPKAVFLELHDELARLDAAMKERAREPLESQARQTFEYLHNSPKTPKDDLKTALMALFLNDQAAHPGADPFLAFKFQPAILRQEIVVQFAQLDALFADVVRIICAVRPEVLARGKEVSWRTIIEVGSWEAVLALFADDYATELGWLTIRDRVRKLAERFGLELATDASLLRQVEDAANLRHLVVHNGGRASAEYLRRTARTDIKIGEEVPLDYEYLWRTRRRVRVLGNDLARATGEKFFAGRKLPVELSRGEPQR